MSNEEDVVETRYDRQKRIDGWGQTGQDALNKGKVVVVGAGALGNFLIAILNAYGMGEITIYDDDRIELHNLARQILFTENDAINKRLKANVVKERSEERNSEIIVNGYDERITEDNIDFLLMPDMVDVIADCVDNIPTRKLINKYAIENDIPLVHMGSSPTGGEICVVTRETACLECFMNLKLPDDPESCRDVIEPSIAETNAVIASLGAGQVRMLIMEKYGESLSGDVIIIPTLYYSIGKKPIPFNHIQHEKKKDCPVCSKYK